MPPFSCEIEGYLYHKSFRECSLDPFGNPADYGERKFNNDWTALLSRVEPDPPRAANSNQSLCGYLDAVPAEQGMRVYIDAAFGRWYDGLVRNLELVREEGKGPGSSSNSIRSANRTLFLCYERLADPRYRVETAKGVLDWLFPASPGVAGTDWDIESLFDDDDDDPDNSNNGEEQELYSGGHSTSHDATVRSDLKAVVEKLDRTTFNGAVATLNAYFGCGGGGARYQRQR